jgi:phage portal protein BeeE
MGIYDRLLGRIGLARKNVSSLELFREVYGGRASKSGVSVTWKSALDVSTVLACCRVIAEGVAQVPFRLYQETNGSRRLASDHPLNRVISRRPNPWQTSFEFRETILFHTILTGNAFVFVNRVGIARECAS